MGLGLLTVGRKRAAIPMRRWKLTRLIISCMEHRRPAEQPSNRAEIHTVYDHGPPVPLSADRVFISVISSSILYSFLSPSRTVHPLKHSGNGEEDTDLKNLLGLITQEPTWMNGLVYLSYISFSSLTLSLFRTRGSHHPLLSRTESMVSELLHQLRFILPETPSHNSLTILIYSV